MPLFSDQISKMPRIRRGLKIDTYVVHHTGREDVTYDSENFDKVLRASRKKLFPTSVNQGLERLNFSFLSTEIHENIFYLVIKFDDHYVVEPFYAWDDAVDLMYSDIGRDIFNRVKSLDEYINALDLITL
jgi:hypothetical protein